MITFDLMMTCIIIMKMTLSWYNRRTGKNEREENKKKKKKRKKKKKKKKKKSVE